MKKFAIIFGIPLLPIFFGGWMLWVAHNASVFVKTHSAETIAIAYLSDDTGPFAAVNFEPLAGQDLTVARMTFYANRSQQLVGVLKISGLDQNTVGLAILASKTCSPDERFVVQDPNPHPRSGPAKRKMGDLGLVRLSDDRPATAIALQDAPATMMFDSWRQIVGYAVAVVDRPPTQVASLGIHGIACGVVGAADRPRIAH